MAFSIKGKVALVTGANRGIGKATVEAFFQHGAAKVYLAVRNISSTKELEAKFGDKVQTLALDLSSQQAVDKLAEQVKDVDIVVNNAGVAITCTPLDSESEQALQTQMDVNVYGLMRIAQAFAPALEAKQGALVQLNSVASLRANPPYATYCASKAASFAITQGLYKQWKEQGVSVVSVHPGPIATDMASGLGLNAPEGPEVVAEAIVASLANDEFLCYPDAFAKAMGAEFQGFAEAQILA